MTNAKIEVYTLHLAVGPEHCEEWLDAADNIVGAFSTIQGAWEELMALRAKAIAEGAVLRLWCGEQCFKRYRREFGLADSAARIH